MKLIKVIIILITLNIYLGVASALETCDIYPSDYGFMYGDSYSCGSFGWATSNYLSASHDRPCVAGYDWGWQWCTVDWAEEFWVQFDLDDCDSDYSASEIMEYKTDADLFWDVDDMILNQDLNVLWVTEHDNPNIYALQADDEWVAGYYLNTEWETKDVDPLLDDYLTLDYSDKIAFMFSPDEYYFPTCPDDIFTDYGHDPNDYFLRIDYELPCGNGVCTSGETYSNCPQDCCDSDCTADYDSTCHSACDNYNGCSLTSGCGGKEYGSTSCVDSDTYRTCCEGGFTDCAGGENCSNGVCLSNCGNEVCDTGETYSNCPQDCCDSDCTATSDSICHVECNAYCGTVDSQCNGDTINSCGDSEGDCVGCDYQSCSGCYDCSGGSCSIDDDTECENTDASCYCSSGTCSACDPGDFCSSYACYSPTGADLAVVDIIPIQVIPDVDMVKGKTGFVRVTVYNYGPEDASGTVTAYFNGDMLTIVEGESATKPIQAQTDETFDFKYDFDTAGTNLEINASVSLT